MAHDGQDKERPGETPEPQVLPRGVGAGHGITPPPFTGSPPNQASSRSLRTGNKERKRKENSEEQSRAGQQHSSE